MSNRAQHYREAERLLVSAENMGPGTAERALAQAQTHAMLASTPNEVYNEYLDLLSLEQSREEVVGAPGADSRDWLAEDEPRCEHCGVVGGGHTFECIAGSR